MSATDFDTHGHVAAALGTIRRIALDRLILSAARDAPLPRHCILSSMMVDRLITSRSKLGFVRAVDEATATSSLGAVLRLVEVKEREAYAALTGCSNGKADLQGPLAGRMRLPQPEDHRSRDPASPSLDAPRVR